MRRDEFIEIHGEEVWDRLIKPRKEKVMPPHIRSNANIIAHGNIGVVLDLMGFKENSLLKAKEQVS